jgi:hypothetical protein
MKKLVFLFSILFVFASFANGQKYLSQPAAQQVAGDTVYFPTSNGYDLKNIESGAFSFTFTHTDVADSLSAAAIQYSNDRVTWTSYTGNAALTATSTDGQDRLYISTSLIDRFVRVRLSCAAGDTVSLSGMVLLLKTD